MPFLSKRPRVPRNKVSRKISHITLKICPFYQQKSSEFSQKNVMFVGGGYTWLRPVSLAKLLELKKAFPKATIVMGSQTVIGLRKNVKMYHITSKLHVNSEQFGFFSHLGLRKVLVIQKINTSEFFMIS